MNDIKAPGVVVITGGSQGIGRACVVRFLETGFRVVTCGRSIERLQELSSAVGSTDRLDCLPADVASSSGRAKLVQHLRRSYDRIEILIHNAGTAIMEPSHLMSDDQLDRLLDLNVRAVFALTRDLVALLERSEKGVIGFVSSMSAFDPFVGLGAYGACKAWVNHFAKSMAVELAPRGIRTFAVCPGAVDTPLLRRLLPQISVTQTLSPADVAELIASLCQAPFRFSSGEIVCIQPDPIDEESA